MHEGDGCLLQIVLVAHKIKKNVDKLQWLAVKKIMQKKKDKRNNVAFKIKCILMKILHIYFVNGSWEPCANFQMNIFHWWDKCMFRWGIVIHKDFFFWYVSLSFLINTKKGLLCYLWNRKTQWIIISSFQDDFWRPPNEIYSLKICQPKNVILQTIEMKIIWKYIERWQKS